MSKNINDFEFTNDIYEKTTKKPGLKLDIELGREVYPHFSLARKNYGITCAIQCSKVVGEIMLSCLAVQHLGWQNVHIKAG